VLVINVFLGLVLRFFVFLFLLSLVFFFFLIINYIIYHNNILFNRKNIFSKIPIKRNFIQHYDFGSV
jgi:hypothetical protein